MQVDTIKIDVSMSWKTVKLEKLCKMNSGGTPNRSIKEYYSGDIPWAKISDIEAAEGGIVYSTEEHITTDGLKAINNRIFEKGTLLLAMYGSVGKLAFTGVDMSTNQAILGIRIIDETVLDYSYLKYWFQTIKNQLLDRAVGGTLQNISLGIVKDLEIPLPPLATQKRIAEILDAADALRRKDQELLKKYEELLQSIYYNLIKDVSGIEKNFILNIIQSGKNKMRSGPFGSDLLHSEFVTKGITVLGIDNVVNNRFEFTSNRFITAEKFNKLQRYQVFKNDVLVTIMGTVGRSAVVPEDIGIAINTKHLVAITLDFEKANPYFISYALTHDESIIYQIKRRSKGAIMDGLNIGIIKELEILLPPIKEQNKFANNFRFIQELKSTLKNIPNSDLFNSLINKAFKGELV